MTELTQLTEPTELAGLVGATGASQVTDVVERTPEGWVRRWVPLTALVTDRAAMLGTLARYDDGERSDTPDEPVWVNVRNDMPGMYEIKDGHHRVAHAIRTGRTHVLVDIDEVPDDEPYQPPFYDFHHLIRAISATVGTSVFVPSGCIVRTPAHAPAPDAVPLRCRGGR